MAALTGGMGMFGKFLQGMAQGKMYKQQRADTDVDNKFKQAQMKFEEAKMKRAEATDARKEKLLDLYLQTPEGRKFFGIKDEPEAKPGEQTTTPMGPSFDKQTGGGGIVDQMAKSQTDFMDPTGAMFLGDATGLGFPAVSAQQQRGSEAAQRDVRAGERIDLREKTFERGFQERIPYTEHVPGRGEVTRFRSKYGQPPEGVVSKLPTLKLKTRIDSKTGEKTEVPVDRTGKEVGKRTVIEPLKGQSAEASAKIALAYNGIQYTKQLKSMFVNPDGTINQKMILSANAPMGGIGEGRTAKAVFLDALDARARAATGAAMPESEIKNYTAMYFPSILDLQNPGTIIDKMKRLDSFMTDYLGTLDPTGAIRRNLIKTPEDVRFALEVGLLSEAEATKMLQEKFGFE
jgi:hypothetical protein